MTKVMSCHRSRNLHNCVEQIVVYVFLLLNGDLYLCKHLYNIAS